MIRSLATARRARRDAIHIRFYSDHISDSAVHHWSDEGFATHADNADPLAQTEAGVRIGETGQTESIAWSQSR